MLQGRTKFNQFYNRYLSGFFENLNSLEDCYLYSLRFTRGADGCYCCNIHKNDLAEPNQLPCADCVWQGSSTHPCYHQGVSDEELMNWLKMEYCEIEQEWPFLAQYPFRNSHIGSGTNTL